MKTVLITGIDRGLGRALAEQFLAAGHRVIGTTRSGAIDLTNERLTVYPLDLAQPPSIADCVRQIATLGQPLLDVLINNAAVLLDETETAVAVDKLRATLEIDLIGTVDLTERLLPLVAKDGQIINISSSAGSLAEVGRSSHSPGHYPSYKIAKAALNMYTRTLALRLGVGPIVSAVHPGWIKTAMGGEEADLTPAEAAEPILALALSRPETGQFWFRGEKYPW